MRKKLLTCLVLSTVLLANRGNTSAATIEQNSNDLISVQSVNTASSRLGFSISNSGAANISAGVVAKGGTSKIRLNVKLQKYKSSSKRWEVVKSWNETFASANASMNVSHKLGATGTYRCILSANEWKNGKVESVNMISVKKNY
jgi:hypothetical protein